MILKRGKDGGGRCVSRGIGVPISCSAANGIWDAS